MRTQLPIIAVRPFAAAAAEALHDGQLRGNLRRATHTIRDRRAKVVAEVPDWEELRDRAAAIKDDVLDRLPELLAQFERAATVAGATIHYATDARQTTAIVTDLVRAERADHVVKIKSMATQEIGLNEALEAAGIGAVLTGCALAVAETGTLVLDTGPGQGRRMLTLIPDHHVCVVRAGQIVADVPDMIAALAYPTRPLTMISGPSATSDIELDRAEGAHGPRRLDIVCVADLPERTVG